MGPQVLQLGRSVKAQRRMSVNVAVLVAKEADADKVVVVKVVVVKVVAVKVVVVKVVAGKVARAEPRPARTRSKVALATRAPRLRA